MSTDPAAGPGPVEERVVLLDAVGRAVGTAPKGGVHHAGTPLHLAFSAYLFSATGELLVTRRALDKATFPGVWTNSVCGHPAPGEAPAQAAVRRARRELGLEVTRLRLVLPRFAYRAEMDGVVEHEMCPVYAAWLAPGASPRLDPTEVHEAVWVPWREFADEVLAGRREVSVWCAEQVAQLADLGPDPPAWPAADQQDLPPAAR
ncbi:isopentenyl-diphosphate Delta-isomerase [Pedococcus sp. 2YAF34]|uniref:isopentenyl-diphosphate Delta-isomerase n=1 Tax=Pedococcus sp. 2YAF34 TaxID=3233032 RepID=UPI003F9C7F8F